jgi:ligand-binding sensor domain-containing protein/signal transduction histidine kinase
MPFGIFDRLYSDSTVVKTVRSFRPLVKLPALLFSACLLVSALDPDKMPTQYAHRIWGEEEGLFQPTIYSILQTRDGFLWLGTQDSLIRFDGMHFREFEHAGTQVLHGSLVRSLLEDHFGNLWVGSVGNGLTRIAPDGSFTRYGQAQGLPSLNVFCVASDSEDRIWACTDNGLVRLGPAGTRLFTTADGLPSNEIRATCEATDGTRWVSVVNYGLAKWNGARFERYAGPGASVVGDVLTLDCARDGTLWAGSSAGVTHIMGDTARTYTTRDGLPDNTVYSLTEGPEGSLWIGTEEGVSRYANGEITVYRLRDGLSHSMVLSLYLDREGNLWAGTKDGLDQFTNPKVTPYTTNQGMSSNEAAALIEDHESHLWIRTLDSGLNVFDGKRFQSITVKNGLTDNHILSLAVGADGDLWAGTERGLNRLRAGKIVARYNERNGLSGSEIRALLVDPQGVLWIGTNGGLNRFDGHGFTPAARSIPGGETGIVALTSGKAVQLIASTDNNRLLLLRDGHFESRVSANVIRPVDCYLIDRHHSSIWMGTLGSGLLRWRNGQLARIHVRDGLFDNRIYSILQDSKQNFWMASSKGIFRVSHDDLENFADGRIKSIASIPFSTGQLRFECRSGVQPAAARTHDGRLWFPTNTGVVVVDPDHLNSDGVPPPVRITAFILNGQRLDLHQPLNFGNAERNLEIHYAGLSFVAPEKVTFRYMLDGYDKTWTDAGTRREAFFTNLPPRDYHFRVMARNADGVWSTEAASVDFLIEPRFYQRRWFAPLVALLLAMTVLAGYRWRLRHIEQGFRLVLAERSRIARELHDTLLQGISGVTMQLQALWMKLPASKEKQMLGEIIRDAGQCSSDARQSLWGLRNDEKESSSFSKKLAKLSQEAVANTRLSLVLNLDPVSLDGHPEKEFQLLRIAKEAIGNTVKHAGASILEISLRLARGELRLALEDNGSGFATDVEHERFGHFGLLGMRERAGEIGATLVVASTPHQGTRISVRLPLGRLAPKDVMKSEALDSARKSEALNAARKSEALNSVRKS